MIEGKQKEKDIESLGLIHQFFDARRTINQLVILFWDDSYIMQDTLHEFVGMFVVKGTTEDSRSMKTISWSLKVSGISTLSQSALRRSRRESLAASIMLPTRRYSCWAEEPLEPPADTMPRTWLIEGFMIMFGRSTKEQQMQEKSIKQLN